MNLLQITNYQCASMSANDNTGINRVVTALSSHFVTTYKFNCFNGYYRANPSGQSEVFGSGIKLTTPLNSEEFKEYLTKNRIDTIIINVSNIDYVMEIPKICFAAHQCGVRTTYCIHFMPGYEACTYFNTALLYFNLTRGIKVLDSIKKWIVVKSRPFSAAVINVLIKKRYLVPFNACDNVVVFTDSYVDRYLAIVGSTNKEKFNVIPNPLPFRNFAAHDSLARKEKEIIVVGRLYEPTKRLIYALRVWEMIQKDNTLNDWRLTIIGDGPSLGYYQWFIKKHNLNNVLLAGRGDPMPFYRRASILLSTSAHEGWPMVLMECMPMGVVPCVFNSYAASTDIIDHNINGMIAPDNDLKAFRNCLVELMSDESKRLHMAAAAVEKSKSFDPSTIGALWKQFLCDIPAEA